MVAMVVTDVENSERQKNSWLSVFRNKIISLVVKTHPQKYNKTSTHSIPNFSNFLNES